MLQFIPNFEVWSAFCPNPKCSGGERLSSKNELFKTGVGIEVYIQDGMETIGVFALGSQSFAVCAQCFTLVPVPCLFPNKKAVSYTHLKFPRGRVVEWRKMRVWNWKRRREKG